MVERWVFLDRIEGEVSMVSGAGTTIPPETHAYPPNDLVRLKLNFTNLLVHVYYTPQMTSQDAMYYIRAAVNDGAFTENEA